MNIAIVGIGNCAWSLLQAMQLARQKSLHFKSLIDDDICTLLEKLNVVAAFDVSETKVGLELAIAARSYPNCTSAYCEIAPLDVCVSAGPLLDGLEGPLAEIIIPSISSSLVSIDDVKTILEESCAEALVIFLPVGAQKAAEAYAVAALNANCHVVNCTPAVLANNSNLVSDFTSSNLILLGDDLRSHVGSTTIHQALLSLLQERGVKVKRTYQLNVGGNADFLNMRDRLRSKAKRRTKAVSLSHLHAISDDMIGIGPSDYIPSLKDQKVGYINIEATGFLGMDITLEVKLSVEDSPNAAAVALDALGLIALNKLGKNLNVANACKMLFKAPRP